MITDFAQQRERRRIELRLAELDIERRALESARQALDVAAANGNPSQSSVTQHADGHEKILLFRSLFRGRTDVYPARWENRSSGKSGYAPACANEWVRGVCEKPRIKCGNCPKQAFIAVSDRIVERHLRGDIVAGIYPLMAGNTCYFVPIDFDGGGWPIAAVYEALAESEPRNARIFDDVLTALEMRRRPLVLTERRDHLELLASRFAPFVSKVIVLRGGMSTRERDAALTTLRSNEPGERLVLATGPYLGEGFDYAPLDTLFLTLPISWKRTLAQYMSAGCTANTPTSGTF